MAINYVRTLILSTLLIFLTICGCNKASETKKLPEGWKLQTDEESQSEKTFIYIGPPLCSGEDRLVFPVVPRSSQSLISSHLIGAFNSNQNNFVDAVYGRLSIRCDMIPWTQPLVWKIHSTTKYLAYNIPFPVVEKGIPWIDILSISIFQRL